jgi:hypothetical protein
MVAVMMRAMDGNGWQPSIASVSISGAHPTGPLAPFYQVEQLYHLSISNL